MAVWVRLLNIQYVEEHGKNVTKYPGDWVKVNSRIASLWISQGSAEVPGDGRIGELYKGEAGVAVLGDSRAAEITLDPFSDDLEIRMCEPEIFKDRMVIWDTSLSLRRELLPIGLMLLDRWEVAAPLCDYDLLASSAGSEYDREMAQKFIRDLRVPLYDPRLVFIRDKPAAKRVVKYWNGYVGDGVDQKIALLMAVYRAKPLILALPITWTDNSARI